MSLVNEREIYLAGGCFWGMQGYFRQLEGVLETKVGYANGKGVDVNYQTIKATDHAETIYIRYDESKIDLETLLAHYFRVIDPTSIDKQGEDRGRQYRTGIYYVDSNDRDIIERYINKEQERYDSPIVVEVEPLENFVLAEDYHQDYLEKNPNGYCHINLSLAKKPLNK